MVSDDGDSGRCRIWLPDNVAGDVYRYFLPNIVIVYGAR